MDHVPPVDSRNVEDTVAPAQDPVDPRVTRSRVAILDAAAATFLEHGYLGTSLERVADRAGVAKRTIYNLFSGKEALFRAVLTGAIDVAERYANEVAIALGDSHDVEADLTAAATELVEAVLGGRIVALRRLLIGEATRFPDVAQEYYDRAPGQVMAALAAGLSRLADRGHLRIDDAAMAAEHLAFLVLGATLDRALFDPTGVRLPPALVRARVTAGVAVFLRAYGPA
jgi:TetR/AcrR family transcriptional regulator, mexJK operon transcriptional repressor